MGVANVINPMVFGGDTKYTARQVVATGKGGGNAGDYRWTADKDYPYMQCTLSIWSHSGGYLRCTDGNVVSMGNVHTAHGAGGAGNRTYSWWLENVKKGAVITAGYTDDWQSSQFILIGIEKSGGG